MNKHIWTSLCEAVWNKEVVIDIYDLNVTSRALDRWFRRNALRVKRKDLISLSKTLSDMLRTRAIQEANYGDHPKVTLEAMRESEEFLKDDITLLRSFTPELLERAAKSAGFEVGVYDITESHPLAAWE